MTQDEGKQLVESMLGRVLGGTEWRWATQVDNASDVNPHREHRSVTISVSLQHPLSMEREHVFSAIDKDELEAMVSDIVEDCDEFAVCHWGPADSPHASLIRKMRALDRQASRTPEHAVSAMAFVLIEENILTYQEARWLESSLPAARKYGKYSFDADDTD